MKSVRISICAFVNKHPRCTVGEIAEGLSRDWAPTRTACAELAELKYLTVAVEYSRGSKGMAPEKKEFTCSDEQLAKLHEHVTRPKVEKPSGDKVPDLANLMHGFVKGEKK